MSKNIKIRRNDTGEVVTFNNVRIIQTDSPDSFRKRWVPADETDSLANIRVRRNGIYPASIFNTYGIKVVIVDVPHRDTITTESGVVISVYLDSKNRPHFKVSRELS